MISGFFLTNAPNVPAFPLFVAWNETVIAPFFVLDTGFTGDLKVNPKTADELGLKPYGVEEITVANGEIVSVPIATAYASMEGVRKTVSIIIGEGSHLAGIGLFTKFGYKAIVDCKI